jgi:predicted nucleotidyltransferase
MATRLQDEIDDICRRYGLAELYVFGSRAAEVADRVRGSRVDGSGGEETSDVDVGVRPLLDDRPDIDAVVALADELEGLLGASRVDVVVLPGTKVYLALDVIRGEVLYCADWHAQAEYELYVLAKAGDLAPYQRARQELALSRYDTR